MSLEASSIERVLNEYEIEELFGGAVHSVARVNFLLSDVPVDFHALVPYARFWGVADDWARAEVVRNTPAALKNNLKYVISIFDDKLDVWLAGSEAEVNDPSDAYIAFSAMRMSADIV